MSLPTPPIFAGAVMALWVLVSGAAPAAARDSDAASAAPTPPAKADADPATPPPPIPVTVGYHITAIRDVDVRTQKFVGDMYMWLRYPTPSATTDTAADEERAKEIEKIEFVDGHIDEMQQLDRKRVGAESYVCWRVLGTFHFTARLRDYPFDVQRLEIRLEHPSLEADALVYLDDTSSYERSGVPKELAGVTDGLDIPEFTLTEVDRRTEVARYRTDFGDPAKEQASSAYSRFVVRLRFARDFMPYFAKIVIPLIVILAMAYLAFLIPAKEIQSASGLVVTALLSTIAFNVAVSQNLPEVGYLVVSDKFFIATYLLLFFALTETVLTYKWDDEGRTEYAQKWDAVGKVAFPILFVAVFGYLLMQALGSH